MRSGIRRVDLLVLPRLDPDRAAGAALLAAERGVERILVGGGWPGTALPAAACRDARFEWDGVVLEAFAAGRQRDYCVLRVSAASHALLLAGDLDAAAERELLARLPPGALASDVVLMSRQAGAAGSSAEWIEASGAGLAHRHRRYRHAATRARARSRAGAAPAHACSIHERTAASSSFSGRGAWVRSCTARSARHPFAWRRFE